MDVREGNEKKKETVSLILLKLFYLIFHSFGLSLEIDFV